MHRDLETGPVTGPASHASPGDTPWHADGLRFECTGCGNCCTGAPGAVWVNDEDLNAMAAHLGISLAELRLQHTRRVKGGTSLVERANGDCTFFDRRTRRCQVYPARPPQCRTWPFWPGNLADEAAWAEIGRECPGVGKGDLVPLAEVERRAEEAFSRRPG